ncbi:Ethylene-responsive transcription factor ERF120 [Raphanus sativus]|nr:Ethylene-responsive transcription factor ERF120 [Raphanus sativus]
MDYSRNNPIYDQKPLYMTRDEEHVTMVSALRQVISNVGSDVASSSSNWNACEALQTLDAGPCPLCCITGCYGCVFPRDREVKKEKKHKGVRKRPSGKLCSNTLC